MIYWAFNECLQQVRKFRAIGCRDFLFYMDNLISYCCGINNKNAPKRFMVYAKAFYLRKDYFSFVTNCRPKYRHNTKHEIIILYMMHFHLRDEQKTEIGHHWEYGPQQVVINTRYVMKSWQQVFLLLCHTWYINSSNSKRREKYFSILHFYHSDNIIQIK